MKADGGPLLVEAAVQATGRSGHALLIRLVGRKVQQVHLAATRWRDARQQRVRKGARVACACKCNVAQGHCKALDRQYRQVASARLACLLEHGCERSKVVQMVTGVSECSGMWSQKRRSVAAAVGAMTSLVWPRNRWVRMTSCNSFLRKYKILNVGLSQDQVSAAGRSRGHPCAFSHIQGLLSPLQDALLIRALQSLIV